LPRRRFVGELLRGRAADPPSKPPNHNANAP